MVAQADMEFKKYWDLTLVCKGVKDNKVGTEYSKIITTTKEMSGLLRDSFIARYKIQYTRGGWKKAQRQRQGHCH
jgi:hypothetical protein